MNASNNERSKRGLVAIMLATLLFAAAAPSPAHAVGMMSVGGKINCQAPQFPLQTVRGTATARGDVDFQFQSSSNYSATVLYVNMGYSSVYAPWSYKTLLPFSGPFYAYGLTSIGGVTKIGRSCA